MKVLVYGTGFAGEGHIDAFRAAGVDVTGIVGRTPSVVSEVADNKGIAYSSNDWQEALAVCKPDIVSIGTPAIIGDVRDDLGKAPIVEGVHNVMTRRNFIPKDLNAH